MNALHPLGKLIQSVEDSKGWTLREIARRVDERTDRTISHAYVAKLKREPIKSISYETIHALSVGLGLPERDVATAAMETMGVHDMTAGGTGAAVAIARDPDLSDRDRRILLAALREMHSGHDTDDTGATSPAGSADPPRDSSPLERDAQPDGFTASPTDEDLAARVRAYLEQHLIAAGRWPDFELLGVDDRETALDGMVHVGVELIRTGLASEQLGMPATVENATDVIARVVDALPSARIQGSADRRSAGDPPPRDRATAEGAGAHPWEQGEYDLAAKHGRNRGREARQQQDRDAEDGGA